MLLGESHYSWEQGPSDESKTTLASIQQGYQNKPFWKKLKSLIFDSEDRISQIAGDEFWSQVLFYNYVQRLLDRPRERPKPRDWAASAHGFQEVLSAYQPDRILVIGKDTWRHMAGDRELPGQEPIKESLFPLTGTLFAAGLDKSELSAYWYSTGAGHFALAAPIFHPAFPGGFYAPETREVVKQLLKKDWKPPLAKAS